MDYSYWVYQNDGNLVFMMNSNSDINKLPKMDTYGDLDECKFKEDAKPCAAGSMAIVATTGDCYILSSDNTWHLL